MEEYRLKIKDLAAAKDEIAHLKAEGQRIVFTNGCFDILHSGHARYLFAARQLGDHLVVAVNSDRSVKAIKESGRPIVAQEDRAELVAALGCVDTVLIFDEDNPYNVIKGLRPDVLVKGGDYGPDRVVGREVVEAVVKQALDIGNTSLLQTAQGFQAELAIRQNKIEEANHWAETYNPDPFNVAYRFYVPQMTMAKWLLLQGTTEKQQQGAHLLNRLEAFFRSTHNTRLLIEVLALKAMHFDVHGAENSALSALEQSITLAQPGGFLRLFMDLGPQMADMLKRLLHKDIARNYIHRILTAFKDDKRSELPDPLAPASAVLQTQAMIEPLTNRELEILSLLAQRLRNKEIAEKLFISPDTVKRHTVNLYAKLKVGDRRQAVSKAYAMGILTDRRSSAGA